MRSISLSHFGRCRFVDDGIVALSHLQNHNRDEEDGQSENDGEPNAKLKVCGRTLFPEVVHVLGSFGTTACLSFGT